MFSQKLDTSKCSKHRNHPFHGLAMGSHLNIKLIPQEERQQEEMSHVGETATLTDYTPLTS